MQKQILFIHSAGLQGPNEGSNDLVKYLRHTLGREYAIQYPIMPDPDNPSYSQWKARLEQELANVDDEVILVGHSLGGSVLLKYLSEQKFTKSIMGMFLVATPYWDKQMEEFALSEDFQSELPAIPNIFLYHSREDDVVPFSHLRAYAQKLPQATVREIEGTEHVFSNGLPELVNDIRNMTSHKALKNMREKILREHDHTNNELWRIISSFQQENINIIPFEGSWTAAQVMSHVHLSDTLILKRLNAVGEPSDRKPDERVEKLKEVFLNFETKLTSPKEIIPENKNYLKEDLMHALRDTRVRINEAITTLDLSEICPDPIFGEITRAELLHFIKYHTERHIHQLKNIYHQLKNNQLVI